MIKKLLILLMPLTGFSQNVYFEKAFGTALSDVSRSVKQLSTGSIYILGNSTSGDLGNGDISLTKTDKFGNWEWTEYYGTSNPENGFYLNVTSDGNFVFTGDSETSSNDLDILIYKVDTSGSVIWNRTYATGVNESARYIEETNDGGFILTGNQNDTSGYYNCLALKLDSDGIYKWHKSLGGTENDYADMIHQLTNKGFILTGDTKSSGAGGYDVVLYELDSLGNETWSQTYGDSLQNGCQGLLMTSDQHYISYGETQVFPFSPFDFYLEKIDTLGNSIWRYTYGGIYADAIFSIREDQDGGFICTGYSNSYNGGAPLDLVILKVDSAGTFLWKETYGGSGIDIGYEIIKAADNNGFIITGKTYSTSEDYYLLRLDSLGLLSGLASYEDKSSALNMFPNPAKEEVFIKYEKCNPGNCSLVYYDLTGRIRLKEKLDINSSFHRTDLSDFEPGIYFCELIEGSKSISIGKIVIIK
jgi:hypothetical protein